MMYYDTIKEAREVQSHIMHTIFASNIFINSIGIVKNNEGYFFEIGCVSGETCDINQILNRVNNKFSDSNFVLPEAFQFVAKDIVPLSIGKSNNMLLEREVIRPGMSISVENAAGNIGTIAAFLESDDNKKYALTCAHILDPSFQNDPDDDLPQDIFAENSIKVCHPGIRSYNDVKNVIGILEPSFTNYDLDTSLCYINPELGKKLDSNVIKFDGTPSKIGKIRHHINVAKYGSSTKDTFGKIRVTDLYLRDNLEFPFIQVDSENNNEHFVDSEDSGSLLFLKKKENNELSVIGILTRSLSVLVEGKKNNSGLAVPITAIFKHLRKINPSIKFCK